MASVKIFGDACAGGNGGSYQKRGLVQPPANCSGRQQLLKHQEKVVYGTAV